MRTATTFTDERGSNYMIRHSAYETDGYLTIPVYRDGRLEWLKTTYDGAILSTPHGWPDEIRERLCAHVAQLLSRLKEAG